MDQTLFKRREVLLIERQIGEDIGQRAIAHFCQQPTDHQRDHHAARCNRGHQLRPSERGTKYSDSQTGASDEERAEVACDNLAERDRSSPSLYRQEPHRDQNRRHRCETEAAPKKSLQHFRRTLACAAKRIGVEENAMQSKHHGDDHVSTETSQVGSQFPPGDQQGGSHDAAFPCVSLRKIDSSFSEIRSRRKRSMWDWTNARTNSGRRSRGASTRITATPFAWLCSETRSTPGTARNTSIARARVP